MKNGNTDLIFMINMVFPDSGATPEYKAAFKALKVRQRLTIQMNFIAFFCSGYIYLSRGYGKKQL